MGDEVLGIVKQQLAVGLFRFRIVSAAEVELAGFFVIGGKRAHGVRILRQAAENASWKVAG